jgi:hypothetical protein
VQRGRSTSPKTGSKPDRGISALRRRAIPLIVSGVYFGLSVLYFFRWGSVVQHIPSSWTMPYDYAYTYLSASQLAHGHLGSIYNSHVSFVEFPGIVVAMAPIGALSNVFHTTLLEVVGGHSYVVQHYSVHYTTLPFLTPGWLIIGGKLLVADPQWAIVVCLYALLLGCVALFAFDALARRLGVSVPRRALLSLVEGVLLWNVTVLWGHPEDAVAVALAVYALIAALDGRFPKSGWLFGAAVAFQPLVLLALPVLLVMAGRRNWIGLAVRSILPAAVLVSVPFVANFSATYHALAEQPNYPNRDHATPWTALSPHLGGKGLALAVAGGPTRLLAILLAVAVAIWVSKRWLQHPELLVFACALVFAFRSYTESVMDAYYPWAALAVGVVVAAKCRPWRFAVALALAIVDTIVAQWNLTWLPWWTIQIAVLTVFLAVVSHPDALAPIARRADPRDLQTEASQQGPSKSGPIAKKPATRASIAAKGRSGSQAGNKRPVPRATTKKSGRN